jgi:hypothetical protein
MKRDALLAKVLLRDHCAKRGHQANGSGAQIIFYYDVRSIPAPLGISGEELDAHFGAPVWEEVESVNAIIEAESSRSSPSRVGACEFPRPDLLKWRSDEMVEWMPRVDSNHD